MVEDVASEGLRFATEVNEVAIRANAIDVLVRGELEERNR